MRYERKDARDWWLTRSWYVRKLPLALMMLLALAAGLGIGAIIMAGHSPAVGQVVQIVPGVPPGEVAKQQTPTASVAPPVFIEEIEILAEPAVARAPTEEELLRYEKNIFIEVNRRRTEAGVPELIWDDKISAVAREHSLDMAQRNYYAHTSPEGRGLAQRFPGQQASENINRKADYSLPLDVEGAVASWWSSPGHRENILRGAMKRTGVGAAISKDGTLFITQNFLS